MTATTNDFVVQRDSGGQGLFFKLLTTGVYTTEILRNAADVVVPGDYDGDGRTDIAVASANNGSIVWSYRPSGGGATVSDTWGISGANGDFPFRAITPAMAKRISPSGDRATATSMC